MSTIVLEAFMKKIIIKGTDSNNLRELAIKEYTKEIKSLKKEEILVFVLQRTDRAYWKENLNERFSPTISSYFSFAQKEIKNNWDLVIKNSKLVNENIEKPSFLTFEGSQTLMVKLVEFLKNKGNLKEINMSNEELAQKMLSNLYYLATDNSSYLNYHKLIQKQVLNKELLKPETYEELSKLLEIYISRTLKEGVIDYPSILYIYNNCLLKDKEYLESLKKFKKIIVWDYPCQIPSINGFLKFFGNISLYSQSSGPYGIYFPNGKKSEKLLEEFETVDLDKDEKGEFLNNFYKNLFYGEQNSLSSEEVVINNSFQTKTEINQYLLRIIKKIGKENKNITILSPTRNPSLEYSISNYCKEEEIPFINLDRNEKILDNPHTYALTSLALIYFEFGQIYLNSDELRQILVLLLDFNYFSASRYCKKIKINKEFLVSLLKNSRTLGESSINKLNFFKDFFEKEYKNAYDFYTAFYEFKAFQSEEIQLSLKKLINISKNFLENMDNFENIKDSNLEFFLSLRRGLKESESLEEIYTKMNFNGIFLGTASSFLNYSKKVDVAIFIDTTNNLWNINFVNIIQNPFLLNSYFEKDFFYDYETNNQLKREELFNLISRIYNCTKEKMLFLSTESDYSSLLKDALVK